MKTCGYFWPQGFLTPFDTMIAESDRMTLEATRLLDKAWKAGLVDAENPFDEQLEQKWIAQRLFHATSLRYAAAMSGPDYATFKVGW